MVKNPPNDVAAVLRRFWPEALIAMLLVGIGAALAVAPEDPNPIDEIDYSAQYNYVIRPGKETEVLRLLDLDPDEPGPVPGVGYWAENIEILEDRIRVEYWSDDGRKRSFVLHHPNAICGKCLRSRFIAMVVEQDDADARRLSGWLIEHLGPSFTALWQERLAALDPVDARGADAEVVEPPRWFGRHPAEIWLVVNQALWVVLGILIAWSLMARARRPGGRRRALVSGAALFAGALGLRLAVATWGPGDLFLNVAEIFWGQPSTFYGNAPNGLLLLLMRVLPERVETLVAVTLTLGSLAVVVAHLLASELEPEDRCFPWAAALIVAVQPVLVRFSGESNRQMYVLFLGVTALWAWLRWERRGRALDAALAVCAATLCVHTRPEAFPILLLLPAATALHIHGGPRRIGSWLGLGVGFIGYAVYYMTTFHTSNMESVYVGNLFTLAHFFLGPEVNLWLDPGFTPIALIVLLPLGLVAGLLRRRRWVLWATAGLLGLAFIASSMPTGLGGVRQLASARYQTLAVLFASLLAGYGVVVLLDLAARHGARARIAAAALIAVAVFATGVVPFRGVTKPTTLDHEYRLMKEWILLLPLRAEIYQPYNYRYNDLGLRDVVHLGRTMGRDDLNWFNWPDEWRPSPNPQFFWRQASCGVAERVDEVFPDLDQSTPALAKTCREVSGFLADHRFLSAELPFRIFLNADKDRGILEVGMYEIPADVILPDHWFPGGKVPLVNTPR
ncbi:MAG: hypothetical protein ABIK09_07145 [Pseudomonadota bacterium]